MKAIFYSLLLFLISFTISAQQFSWVRTFKSKIIASSYIEDIATDINGNVYSVGNFSDTLFLDTTILPSHLDTFIYRPSLGRYGFIIKHDSDGNLIWKKSIYSSNRLYIRSLKIDNLENVYLVGDYDGMVDFNPSDTAQFILGDSLNQWKVLNTFICKLNQQGEFVWAKSFNGMPSQSPTGSTFNHGYSIELDKDNDIIVAGDFMYIVDFDPGPGTFYLTDTLGKSSFNQLSYIAKLRNDGSFVWAKKYATSGNSIHLTPKNNIIYGGSYYDTIYFPTTNGNVALDPIGSRDNFIAKLDSNGNAIWLRSIGSEANDNGKKLVFSNSTHIYYLMKSMMDTLYYNTSPISISNKIKYANILLKINLDGKLEQTQYLSKNGIEYQNMVSSKNKDGLYLIGNPKFNPEFYFDTSIYIINGRGNCFIHLDSSLKNGWIKTIGPFLQLSHYYSTYPASTDLSGNFYSGGYYNNYYNHIVDFDPGKGVVNKSSFSLTDLYLLKLSPCKIQRSIRKDTICGGDSLVVGENVYKESGSYIDNYFTVNGCDSLVTTVLFVKRQRTDTANYKICEGDSVVVDGISYKKEGQYVTYYPLSNHCDSTFVFNIMVDTISRESNEYTICKGDSITVAHSVYNVSGTYWDTLQSKNGCDSIIYTKLTVNPTYTIHQKKILCFGEKLSIGNSNYTKSGNYSDSLLTSKGCDSIINTHLIINDQIINKQSLHLCAADSAIVGHHIYTSSGTYFDTLIAQNGCDSLIISTIEKIDLTIDTNSSNWLTVYQKGASYQWLDCNDELRPLVGETNQSLSIRNSGSYAVEVSYKNCKDTSECIAVKFKEIKANSFLIYPNPANKTITMVLPTAGNLQLFDSIGKLVLNQDFKAGKNTLDVGLFASGLYTLKFNGKFGVINGKLVISR